MYVCVNMLLIGSVQTRAKSLWGNPSNFFFKGEFQEIKTILKNESGDFTGPDNKLFEHNPSNYFKVSNQTMTFVD